MGDGREAYLLLKEYRHLLTRQQVQTLSGQIRHGHPNEAMNGLAKILNRRGTDGKADASRTGK